MHPVNNVYFMRRVVALTVLAAIVMFAVLAVRSCGSSGSPTAGGTDTPQKPAPATDVASRLARANVPVLCYHQIRHPAPGDTDYVRSLLVSPEVFDEQLTALQQAGYTTITAEQYVAHIAKGTELPPKPVLLTFDDGHHTHYDTVLPALKRHDMVGTFFIMTVVLGNPGWVTRDQVREMRDAGMSIGSHTWDHQSVKDLKTAKDFKTQFTDPRKELEQITGKPVTTLAYPFGIWTPKVFPQLGKAGYRVAFQLAEPISKRSPMLTVRRIIAPQMPGDELIARMDESF